MIQRNNTYIKTSQDSKVQHSARPQASLVQKIKQYLNMEREIRLLDLELLSLQSSRSDFDPEHEDLELEIKDGYQEADLNDKELMLARLLGQFEKLKKEVVQMLPEQNKFIEVSLGYRPSMVGYFTTDPETSKKLAEPVLKVVP